MSDNKVKLSVTIDETTIYQFDENINEQSIIKSAKHIEELLKENGAKPSKIQDVFELLVEIMQNMLYNSYENKNIDDKKKEAKGSFVLSYSTKLDEYTMQSCNLIDIKQQSIIDDRLLSIKHLDDKALRKLAREKMRSKEHLHEKGAGLGFIMMQRKSVKPIVYEFSSLDKEVIQYKLTLVV